MKVYLAGTISKKAQHIVWRQLVRKVLTKRGHEVLSPLRFQDPSTFTENGLHDTSTPDSFFVKVDVADLKKSDACLMVFWKQERQSLGTWAELGICLERHIPLVLVTDDPLVADHPFAKAAAAIIVPSVPEGLRWLQKMLL